MTTSKVENSRKRQKTGGRVAGTPNKVTRELKEQILDALANAGGVDVVDELEGPHELTQLRHDDLRAIRDKYRKMANDLSKSIEKTN